MTLISNPNRHTGAMVVAAGAAALIAWSSTAVAQDPVRYRIVELGSLPGGITEPTAMNNSGQVTGLSGAASINNGGKHAFRWDPIDGQIVGLEDNFDYSVGSVISESGVVGGYGCMFPGQQCAGQIIRCSPNEGMQVVGTLGGNYGDATDANASGAFVGYWNVGTPQFAHHAFLVDAAGKLTDLGTLGGSSSWAKAINDSNQVVGYAYTETAYRAFLWDAGVMTDLGTVGGNNSQATDVNNHGAVVGFSQASDLWSHAFLYTEKSGMIDLHAFLPASATQSHALFINDAGMVLVEYYDENEEADQLARWSETEGLIPLGSLPIESIGVVAAGMNAQGAVVGTFHDPVYASIPFYWSPETGMVDLNSTLLASPEWIAMSIADFNDQGQILMTGWDLNHMVGAVLMPVGIGDLDGDDDVDFDDLSNLLAHWGACSDPDGPCPADYNGNGEVDFDDLVALLAHWS